MPIDKKSPGFSENNPADNQEYAAAAPAEKDACNYAALEEFASVVAHDLRSPLLTIAGYCQLLEEEYSWQLPTAGQNYIKRIVDGAHRMSRLIEDMLDYSKAGHSRQPFEPIAMESILIQTRANLESSIREQNASLEIGPMPSVVGDHTQMVRLFQNLVDNAIKFHGPHSPKICVTASRDGNYWLFNVEDNGIGIPQEQQERIFQAFYRLHGQEYPGNGIGLAVCKKIVERHGGRIWVNSAAEQGSIFRFTIPDR